MRAGLLREAHKLDLHTSSATPEWSTPQDLFEVLADEFAFTVDVCATRFGWTLGPRRLRCGSARRTDRTGRLPVRT
jgi:hypothetical protein